MILPTIELVDERGNQLPYNANEPDVQYIKQFDLVWFVRLDSDWSGQVALLSNDKRPLPLVLSKNKPFHWYIPNKNDKVSSSLIKRYKQTIGGSGRLQIGLIDNRQQPVPLATVKYLDILPSNISLAQLQRMIADIGLLTLSAESQVILRNITSSIGEDRGVDSYGFAWDPGDGTLATTTSILRLVQVLQQELPRLKAHPLRTIKVDVGPVRAHKTLSRHSPVLSLYSASSEKSTVVTQTRKESLDCTENQFVRFVLHLLELRIPYAIEQLKCKPLPIPSFPENFITYTNQSLFFDKVKKEQESRKVNLEKLASERAKGVADLNKALDWLAQERSAAFWNNISEPTGLPNYSLRLRGSPFYAAIYSRFQQLWGHTRASVDRIFSLLQGSQQGHVHPVWQIYELWCFVNLYYSFAYQIQGLQCVDRDLVEALTIVKGELSLPHNTRFTLKGNLPSGSPLEIAMWYEPELVNRNGEPRTPDILVEIKLGRSDGIYFIFDCKYRNYQAQGARELVNDVIGVARFKYLESGLRFKDSRTELDLKGSFILHTSRHIDYWGEVPFKQYVDERFGQSAKFQPYDIKPTERVVNRGQTLDNEFAGHKYGAIFYCVDDSQDPQHQHQFRRLLYLLLYYFVGECGLCPHCGVNAELAQDHDREQGQGRYYLCPSCKRFWVEHFCCANNHHRIIKLGNDSFHRPADESGKWHYICPECGAVLRDRRKTKAARV